MILQKILILCMLFQIFKEVIELKEIIQKKIFQDNVKQVSFGKSFCWVVRLQ